ncbi:MAG: hypothetical protein HFG49_03020 [Lachnospiraceae bacterium]|jgi:hypothetical protein|nr:hypothetical protein [Lachnospiraceae bacterium]
MNASMKFYRNKFACLDHKEQHVMIQRAGKEGASDSWNFWSFGDKSYKQYASTDAYCIFVGIISPQHKRGAAKF